MGKKSFDIWFSILYNVHRVLKSNECEPWNVSDKAQDEKGVGKKMASADRRYVRMLIDMLRKIDYIKPGEIPNIDLYMDQVTTFMDKHLESSKRYSEDKLLTKTMINNYTKNNLLPPPEKKKYSKDHMFLLIFIYYLKNILSITDIKSILEPLSEAFYNDKEEDINLEGIYKQIFALEKEQAGPLAKDVIRKYEKAQNSFSNVQNEEEREYLHRFAFICMLSFDVYMKKQMIEAMIDLGMKNPDKKEEQDSKENADKKKKEES